MSIDLVVLISIVLLTAYWARLLWRRGARGRSLASAIAAAFLGIVLVATMTAHTLDVLSRLWIGTTYQGGTFQYSFRAYSLFLLGAVLITVGIQLLAASLGLGMASERAYRGALFWIAITLLLVLPLVPIQRFFAIPLSVLASVIMLLVAWFARPLKEPSGRPSG